MHEKELSELCKKHNAKAERLVFERYASLLRGVCYRYVNSLDETEDLLQDSFIKIFDSIDSFTWRGDGSFTAWMRRIAVNTSINALNKKKRFQLQSLTIHNDLAAVDEHDELSFADLLADAGISPEQLLDILHDLPEMYRTVFNLAVIDGMKHKEIATLMGIDESSSRSRLLRAKNSLRQSVQALLKHKTTTV